MFVNTAAPEPAPGALIAFEKNGDPAAKVDLLLLGDGYTAAERREVRGRFPAPARRALRDVAVQGAAQRLQRLGARAGGARVRDLAAVQRHPSQQSDQQHLRRLRLRTLRPDVRQQGVPPPRLLRALRRRRDRRQRAHLRRRRHLRPLQHRGGRQRLRALRVRPRVRPSLRGAGGRVLHVAGRLSAGDQARRAVGAERHGAARSRRAEVEGSRSQPGTPLPTPWQKDAYEKRLARVAGAARQLRAEQAARVGDGGAVRRGAAADDAMFATVQGGSSAPSKARATRPTATTGPRPTASCSRARTSSAPSAAARSSR